jgi:hypothetical protein
MANQATITVELRSKTQEFERKFTRATDTVKKKTKEVEKATGQAGNAAKGFQDKFRRASQSIAAIQGPLGPVAGRLTSLGTIIGNVGIKTAIATLSIAAIVFSLGKMAAAGARAERQFHRLEGILKATGGAAGLALSDDSFGASVTYANLDTATAWGLNGYYTFESNLPSISLGYEFTENDDTAAGVAVADSTQWFAGLQWDEIGSGTLGVAAGNKGPQPDGGIEEMAYEVFYSYPVNDSMTITPAAFILENNLAGEADETGVVVKTSFSF